MITRLFDDGLQQTRDEVQQLRESLAELRQNHAALNRNLNERITTTLRHLRHEQEAAGRELHEDVTDTNASVSDLRRLVHRHQPDIQVLHAGLEGQRQLQAAQAARLGAVTTENEDLRAAYNGLLTRVRNLEQCFERRARTARSLGNADRSRSASPQERVRSLSSRAVQRSLPWTRQSTQALAQSAEIIELDDSAMEE